MMKFIAELLESELENRGFKARTIMHKGRTHLYVCAPDEFHFEKQTDAHPISGKIIRGYSVEMTEHGAKIFIAPGSNTLWSYDPPLIRTYRFELGDPNFNPELLIKRIVLWFGQRITKCT